MKLILILIIISLAAVCEAQENKVDSLKREIEGVEKDSVYFNTLLEISKEYIKVSNKDSAFSINKKMFYFLEKNKERSYETKAVRDLANIYYKTGGKDSAFSILKRYAKELTYKDTLDVAEVNMDIGYKYYLQGDNVESLIYYLEAVHSFELLGSPLKVYNGLRYGYSRIGDKKEALKYANKMLKACSDSNYKVLMNVYLNKGYYEFMLHDYVSSFESSKKALGLCLGVLNDSVSYNVGLIHGNIAGVYLYVYEKCPDSMRVVNPYMANAKEEDLKQMILDSSKISLDKYHEVFKLHKANLFDVYKSYGQWYLIQEEKEKALGFFEKSFKMTSGSKLQVPERRDVSIILSKIYKERKGFGKALFYFEEYIELKDSLNNEKKLRTVGKQEAKFEFEKQKTKDEAQRVKDKAIEDAKTEQEKAVAKEQEKNQQIITYSIVFGLLLISLFTVVIFKRLRIAKKQQLLIKFQKQEIEKNRNQMLESIEYSKNIQQRIFLSPKELKELLPNSFLYFRPKDVVSGDFYWAHKKGNKVYFSVADCTGHGVPGAFMTLISLNLINAIILEEDVNSTATILERLHVKLQERLTTSDEERMKHGLDVAMCAYDYDTGILEYSGLHNPLYIIDAENELTEIKGDNLFLGISENFNVTSHKIKLEKGSTVYMSTDGFSDQKGGDKGKKYYCSRLRNSLRIVNTKPMAERRLILDEKFKGWKGEKEQIDDICVMGVKF